MAPIWTRAAAGDSPRHGRIPQGPVAPTRTPSLSFDAMDPTQRTAILAAFEAGRSRLPPVADVRARPNVSRLASLSRPQGGAAALNLSTAVVEAGPEAWRLVAPALEGDRGSLERLRALTRDGVRANRTRRGGGARSRAAAGVPSRRPGPPRHPLRRN
jgi:hypothetical protein